MSAHQNRVFRVYLGVLAVIGCIVVYLATSKMGPGISTDSAIILSTADSLVEGRGLVDYSGLELTQFPPLYSVILAFGNLVTGQDVFVVAWFLNLLAFGLLIWLSGQYVWDACSGEPMLAYFAAFVVASSASLIKISANVASELLFIIMLIMFLRCSGAYLETGQAKYALLAAALAGVACFQRYAGLTMAITGSLIVAYRHRDRIRNALTVAALFGLVTAGPILAWGLLHNTPVNGTILGERLPAVPTLNLITGAEKVLYWFLPYRAISTIGTLTLLAIAAGTFAVTMLATGAARYWEGLKRPQVLPSIIFLGVYSATLIFGISSNELKGLETDRVHIVILTPLLVILSAIGFHFLRATRRNPTPKAVSIAAVALLLVWAIYPISKAREYVQLSMVGGDVSPYNSINKGGIRDSALAHYLLSIDLAGRTVYTNGPDTAWFILRNPVARSPWLQTADRAHELEERFRGWPNSNRGSYVLWLHAEAHKQFYATPEELNAIADLHKLYSDGTGDVYSVEPRQ